MADLPKGYGSLRLTWSSPTVVRNMSYEDFKLAAAAAPNDPKWVARGEELTRNDSHNPGWAQCRERLQPQRKIVKLNLERLTSRKPIIDNRNNYQCDIEQRLLELRPENSSCPINDLGANDTSIQRALDDTIETVQDSMRENDSASRPINETVHEDIRENASASCPINDLGATNTSIQRALKLLHDPPSHRRKEMMGKLANTLEENRKSRQEHLSTCTEPGKIDKTIVALGLNIEQLRQLYKAQKKLMRKIYGLQETRPVTIGSDVELTRTLQEALKCDKRWKQELTCVKKEVEGISGAIEMRMLEEFGKEYYKGKRFTPTRKRFLSSFLDFINYYVNENDKREALHEQMRSADQSQIQQEQSNSAPVQAPAAADTTANTAPTNTGATMAMGTDTSAAAMAAGAKTEIVKALTVLTTTVKRIQKDNRCNRGANWPDDDTDEENVPGVRAVGSKSRTLGGTPRTTRNDVPFSFVKRNN